ncbi:hypothetical protein ED312_22675 [Sinomicrobium pectinilyticum]|uniref:LysM domain-containing protein n=1 Tax=Sinomicrobium pectinilyticum TaxID=1084421 RepID=A0A3N0D0P1_SINP1|nr:hypothetical protein [Sinomicrobium pectinilyticum]RNL69204.1 hypothetical protein ED312_22675 [Sinomicrobium pectinilyticum]
MPPKYRTYKINEGDTLISVARALGITPQEAKRFHNVFSSEDDLIDVDLPSHLRTLYVYPHIYEKVGDNPAFVKFNYGYTLRFKPAEKPLNYGVMYTISSGEKEENTLKYRVRVTFVKQDEKGYVFEINRLSKTYVNDEEASEIADELAEKVSGAVYPLEVVIDEDGNWMDIANHPDIRKRWKQVKKRIFEEYDGAWVEQYVAESEASLVDKELLKKSLSGDWFLAAYFGQIYVDYTPGFVFENRVSFPVVPFIRPVKYTVKQEVKMLLDEYGLVQISQEGSVSDNRSKADLENRQNFPHDALLDPDSEKAEGTYKAKYFLNAGNNLIESLFLECSLQLEKRKEIKVVVSLLEDK